jgi:hypothetical protein
MYTPVIEVIEAIEKINDVFNTEIGYCNEAPQFSIKTDGYSYLVELDSLRFNDEESGNYYDDFDEYEPLETNIKRKFNEYVDKLVQMKFDLTKENFIHDIKDFSCPKELKLLALELFEVLWGNGLIPENVCEEMDGVDNITFEFIANEVYHTVEVISPEEVIVLKNKDNNIISKTISFAESLLWIKEI